MSNPSVSPAYYADFAGMEALKKSVQQQHPTAIREAARQFESLFTNMLLKSMREASMGEGLGDSEQTEFYQGMFDQQLALQLARGRGIGLAEHLVEQLQRTGITPGAAPATAPGAAPGAAQPASSVAPATSPGTAAVHDRLRQQTPREGFITGMLPYATEAARRLGVAPETIIAHAALETGWGRHLPADSTGSSHNLFGIKAGSQWQGGAASVLTTEYQGHDATSVRAPFRRYDSVAACLRDYAGLLCGNPRYAGALNQGDDVAAFAAGLQRGGYATDPAYVQKLVATAAAVREIGARTVLKSASALPLTNGGGTA